MTTQLPEQPAPSFPCTKCGACCMDVRGLGLPLGSDGRRCLNLTPDLLCAIYETRPGICRVDGMKPPGMPTQEWHDLNAAACAELQAHHGLPLPNPT